MGDTFGNPDTSQFKSSDGGSLGWWQFGAGLGVNLLNLANSIYQNFTNRAFSNESASTAYNRQVELMDMQNEYNSPGAQMQRLVDAGLNPYLAQGGMSNSLAAPDVNQANFPYSHSQMMGDVDVLAPLQARLLQAQIRDINSQADNREQLRPWQIKQIAARLGVDYADAARLAQEVIESNQRISESAARIGLLSEQKRAQMIDNYVSENVAGARIESLMAQFGMDKIKAEKFSRILESSIAQAFGSSHQSEAAAERMKQMTASEVRLNNMMAAYYQNAANKTLTEQQVLDLERALKDEFGVAMTMSQIDHNYNNPFSVATSVAVKNSKYNETKLSDLRNN